MLPRISDFPTGGSGREGPLLAGGERAALPWIPHPPTADSKTAVLASTTSGRVSTFGASWSQRRRPSVLDQANQANQTGTRWRGRILCLDRTAATNVLPPRAAVLVAFGPALT